MYLSNRVLNEEIEYVLQRRNLEDQIGNLLPMPSLLLKRAYKRDCNNEEEVLEDGENYSREDADMGATKKKNGVKIKRMKKVLIQIFIIF
jgi:hypothetical protein